MNQIVNMVIRQVLRRLINLGINKGFDAVAKRNSSQADGEVGTMSAEQQKIAAENKKRAKQAMRVARRVGR